MLRVVADRDDFRRGATFRMADIVETHAAGYWPVGITFEMDDGRRVRVCGALLIRSDDFICDIRDSSGTYRWRSLSRSNPE